MGTRQKSRVRILALSNRQARRKADFVAREEPLFLHVNGQELMPLLCTPGHKKYLTYGVLFTWGFIRQKSDVRSLEIKDKNIYVRLRKAFPGLRQVSCPCVCQARTFLEAGPDTERKPATWTVSPKLVVSLARELEKLSVDFRLTGGLHSAALADRKGITIFHEDVARHNAVDKVIGEALVREIDLENRILLLSGRMSAEVVAKVSRANIPVVISRGAPTSAGIRLAQARGITLVGFARARRFNIYSGWERIKYG